MEYHSKFDMHQRVWRISQYVARKIVKCTVCECTGSVTIKGEELECPKCEGRSGHYKYVGNHWFVEHKSSPIGKITIEHQERGYDSGRCNKVTYMIEDTGIGSGNVWEEDVLFATEEEANAKCKLRNGDLSLEPECELKTVDIRR